MRSKKYIISGSFVILTKKKTDFVSEKITLFSSK